MPLVGAQGDMSTAIPHDQQQRELTEGESESQGDGASPLQGMKAGQIPLKCLLFVTVRDMV